VKSQPGTPAALIGAMADTLHSLQIDLGDSREVMLALVAKGFSYGDILAHMDLAVERSRMLWARDADRLQRQFLDGERIR
jgi:phosphoribosylformylglycinamidine (FGAM) synthase-like amidotransferase family enzyme